MTKEQVKEECWEAVSNGARLCAKDYTLRVVGNHGSPICRWTAHARGRAQGRSVVARGGPDSYLGAKAAAEKWLRQQRAAAAGPAAFPWKDAGTAAELASDGFTARVWRFFTAYRWHVMRPGLPRSERLIARGVGPDREACKRQVEEVIQAQLKPQVAPAAEVPAAEPSPAAAEAPAPPAAVSTPPPPTITAELRAFLAAASEVADLTGRGLMHSLVIYVSADRITAKIRDVVDDGPGNTWLISYGSDVAAALAELRNKVAAQLDARARIAADTLARVAVARTSLSGAAVMGK